LFVLVNVKKSANPQSGSNLIGKFYSNRAV